MDFITQMLFRVSSSLLIPNIIALLILFVYSLIMLGSFYNSYLVKRRLDQKLVGLGELKGIAVLSLIELLPQDKGTIIGSYIKQLLAMQDLDDDTFNYLLSQYEGAAEQDLNRSRLMSKVGPVLGLMGTLISMSPALTGLSSGDIEGMAYNMQIVFATTVVGLVISLVGLITLQYKQRWYSQGLATLEYIGAQLLSKSDLGTDNNSHKHEPYE